MIVDAHHHLWDLEQVRYPWLTADPDPEAWVGDLTPIQRSYLVDEYVADACPSGVALSVHVEAACDPRDSLAETRWLQAVADGHGFPHAIVAAVRLEEPGVDDVLEDHVRSPNVRGVRQMLDRDEGLSLMERPDWQQGLARLAAYGLSFDLQVNPDQLDAAADLAGRNPELALVLNHCGMPRDRRQPALDQWRTGVRRLAAHPNVTAKISGLGMFDHTWTADSIRPYVHEMFDAFGAGRCMFGSNFPLDGLYSSYDTLVGAMEQLTATLGPDERRAFFHDTAVRVYRL